MTIDLIVDGAAERERGRPLLDRSERVEAIDCPFDPSRERAGRPRAVVRREAARYMVR